MSSLFKKIYLHAWGAKQLVQLGIPEITLGFLGGIGDDLLCSVAIREWLKRGAKKIWFFSRYPELHQYYDRRVCILPEEARYQQLAKQVGQSMKPLSYSQYDPLTDRDSPLPHPIIAAI